MIKPILAASFTLMALTGCASAPYDAGHSPAYYNDEIYVNMHDDDYRPYPPPHAGPPPHGENPGAKPPPPGVRPPPSGHVPPPGGGGGPHHPPAMPRLR